MKLTLETAFDFIKQHPKLVVAEDYELVSHKRDNRLVSFKNGEISEQSNNSFQWIQLRVLHRKRVGVATTVFGEEGNLNNLVDMAFELADNTAVNPWFRFPLWKPTCASKDSGSSERNSSITFDDLFFESLFPKLVVSPVGLEERYFAQRELKTLIRKTEKSVVRDSLETQKLQFFLVNQAKDDFYRIEESRGFSFPFKAKEDFLESLMRKASRLNSARAIKRTLPGKYILSGVVMASLLKSIDSYFLGPWVSQGKSRLGDSLDKQIFSEKVFLKDNGLIELGEGNQKFDLEGSVSQQTSVVEAGVLKSFLHDASSAARFNRGSTGNLILSEGNIPTVGVTNFYLAPSDIGPMDLFEQMGEGTYIECLDKTTKELTRDGKIELLGHGWRVKSGEPVEPMSHVFLSVDPIEILKQITLVANDLDFWGRYGAPSVFIDEMPLRNV